MPEQDDAAIKAEADAEERTKALIKAAVEETAKQYRDASTTDVAKAVAAVAHTDGVDKAHLTRTEKVKEWDKALGVFAEGNLHTCSGRDENGTACRNQAHGLRFASYIMGLQTGAVEKAGLTEGTVAAGGALVPVEYWQDLVPTLESKVAVRAAGARVHPMPYRQTIIPRKTVGGTAAMVAEAGQGTVSTLTFNQITMTAHDIMAIAYFSNDLMRDSTPAAAEVIRDDLVLRVALLEDLQFIRGDGTGNNITGIKSQTGVNVTSIAATNGTQLTYAGATTGVETLMNLVEQANANFVKPAWLCHARTLHTIRGILDSQNRPIFLQAGVEFTGSGQLASLPGGTYRGTLLGFPLFVSNQIPINITKGTETAASELYFGDFSEAVIGQNQDVEVAISDSAPVNDGGTVYTFQSNQSVVRVLERVDFQLTHGPAFAACIDVKP